MAGTTIPVRLSSMRRPRQRAAAAALVNMPYASIYRPSIQIGLLRAIAEQHGHRAQTFHFNVEFARALTELTPEARDVYDYFSEQRFAAGDWFFSEAAFGEDAPDAESMIDLWEAEGRLGPGWRDALRWLRGTCAPAFVDRLAAEHDWSAFDVVGFTSTFQQNVASFALARRIAALHPNVRILFGGANFDGEMGVEWMRAMPFIDHVVRGEADASFPALLDAVAADEDPAGIPGVLSRRGDEIVGAEPVPFEGLASNPAPDYTEYFELIERTGLVDRIDVMVPFESARGCWWGQKRHCTFCGLNGQTMRFRSRPAQTVLDELTALALTHRVIFFTAVDNIIEMEYLEGLLPALARSKRPLSLFYETKADLSREQIEQLVAGGVDSIQPGIESLSSHVLGLMRKGTRAAWNVNLLRWARHHELDVRWNVIWGFPAEREEDAKEQAETAMRLTHLQPPGGVSRLWMERFSPLFVERDRFPLQWIRPDSSYAQVYPAHIDMEAAAYFFEYELADTLPDTAYRELAEACGTWRRTFDEDPLQCRLEADDDGAIIRIVDTREPSQPRQLELSGLVADVHRACMDTWRPRRALYEELDASPIEIDAAIGSLDADRLVFLDGNLVVALALPARPAKVRGRMLAAVH